VRRAAVVAALALAGCALIPDSETIAGPGFVLVSPFGQDATERWRRLVGDEVAAVAALFRTGLPDPPATIVLDPIEVPESATVVERLDPRVDGLGGVTTPDGRIRIVVGREKSGLFSTSIHAKLRHELAHFLLHAQCPVAPLWLHEGLAHQVDDCVETRNGLAFHPAPVRLALARARASEFDVSSLWTWERSPPGGGELESSRRLFASAFVRFLLEREGRHWPGALPRLAALRPEKDPDLVAAWRTWLQHLDFVGLVEKAVADPDAKIRAEAANVLPQLAGAAHELPALRECVGARTDALALRVLADPACWYGASAYLVWFRASALSDGDVGALRAPASPTMVRLVGLALAARRGTAVDADEFRALVATLPANERWRLVALRPFLPGVE
jgi:hypothetical protein